MKHHIEIINGIKEIVIEMNESAVSNEEICLVNNKYKNLLNELNK